MDRSAPTLHFATLMPPSPAAMEPPNRRCSKKNRRTVHVSVFKYTPVPLPERDWAELHPDLISCILHRLDQAELLIGGVAGVCRSWRRAAREEPELWRRIDLRGGLSFVPPFRTEVSLPTMLRAALRYSAGRCEAFLGDRVSDDTLLELAQRAPLLKSLHLIKCFVSDKGFEKAAKMLPLLEELEISLCSYLHEDKVVELVIGACPHMKHLRLVTRGDYINSREVAFALSRMDKLRSLNLVGLNLYHEELMAILHNCHNLEYLNMRNCGHVVVDDNLRLKFAQINMDDREYLSDYDCRYLHYFRFYHAYNPTCIDLLPSYTDCDDDSYDAYYYYTDGDDDVDDADIEEHEKILDIKNMRRYLR